VPWHPKLGSRHLGDRRREQAERRSLPRQEGRSLARVNR
jgi:hypothetical protein